MHTLVKKISQWPRRFWQSESGSQTIEFVIWMPIFVFIIIITMNVSMVFYKESQMLRIVQDANRSFSMGRIRTEAGVIEYVAEKIAYMNVNPTISTDLSSGIITTQLSVPATELMPFTLLDDYFSETKIGVSSSHFVEY
ncbi:TadE/TadG family type IV pilus assembly protein [Marimonas lutisalis]|uniref:TadE/TadG family type IV pilus assembly protein n=1 Tax=Marimonas lutisalis TaxID=2545756 RepID=UPI0010F4A904|nr:TadE family protein [Marimonas lutisalis]